MRSFCLAVVLAMILAAIAISCHTETAPPASAPVTQRVDLTPHLHGSIVVENEDGAIVSLSMPALAQRIIRPAGAKGLGHFFVQSVAGPDHHGRIAFVDGSMSPKLHRLKLINMDGSNERQLFQREGDPIWDHVIGRNLAMSNEGQIALISELHGVQFPRAYLQEGMLQICDANSGAVSTIAPAAIDEGISWFPDGKRLAFVTTAPAKEIGRTEKPIDDWYVPASDDSDRVLAVGIFDIASKQLSIFHSGWLPVVATDGQSMLISDMDVQLPDGTYSHHTRRFSVSAGSSEAASAPEFVGPYIALYADGTVIYQGRQTESPTYTKAYSPLMGKRQLVSIKASMLNSKGYMTLLPSFDFRDSISFSP